MAACLGSSGIAAAVVEQPFAVRYETNDHGGIWVTGSTQMTCPAVDPACAAAQAGTARGAALSNNAYAMGRVDVDADPATFASSASTVAPPAGYSVLWAGLYWGGRTSAGTGGAVAPSVAARGSVLLRTPGSGGYVPVAGAVADSAAVSGAYTGFAEVTGLVAAGGPGRYTVANVQSGTGLDRYGGWALVVAFREPSQPLRNVTIFDGLAAIQQGDPPLSLTVDGFVTPRSGAVRTAVGLVAYEGDRGSAGDVMRLNGVALTDAANPANNLFNSSVSAEGVDTSAARDPGYVNQLGFDSDRIVTSGLIANGATSATLEQSTTLDQYLTQMVSLTTELSAPVLSVSKRVENVTRGGGGAGGSGAVAQPGDRLRYVVEVRNVGDDPAVDVVVSDPAPAGTAFAAGSGGSAGVGTIAPGAVVSVSFDVVVAAGARDGDVISNVAQASGRGATAGYPVSAASAPVQTVVSVPAVLPPPVPVPVPEGPFSVVTTVTPSPPVVGETAIVRTVLENTSGRAIDDVVVTVSVPGADVLGATARAGRCTASGSVARCAIGTVDAGERVVVRLRVRPRSGSAGRAVRPVVTVRGTGISPQRVVLRGGRAAVAPAALRVSVRSSARTVRPGGSVSFRVRVRSVGGVAARGVRLCWRVAPALTPTSVSGAGAVLRRSGAACLSRPLRALAPGRSVSFVVTARAGLDARAQLVPSNARASAANVRGGRLGARALVQIAPLRVGACAVPAGAAAGAGRPDSPVARGDRPAGPVAQSAC